MYIGYQRLTKGRDHDLNKEYKSAINSYSEGIDLIVGELEKEKDKATEDILNKLEGYMERIKELKKLVSNKNDDTIPNFPSPPNTIILPQQPNKIPMLLPRV